MKPELMYIDIPWTDYVPVHVKEEADLYRFEHDYSAEREYWLRYFGNFGMQPLRPAHSVGILLGASTMSTLADAHSSVSSPENDAALEAARQSLWNRHVMQAVVLWEHIGVPEVAPTADELHDRYSGHEYKRGTLHNLWDHHKALDRLKTVMPKAQRTYSPEPSPDDYQHPAHPRKRAVTYGALIMASITFATAEEARVNPEACQALFGGNELAAEIESTVAVKALQLHLHSLPPREAQALLTGR
jgi:hypothetical protein